MSSKGISHQVGSVEVSPVDGTVTVGRRHKGMLAQVKMAPHHTSVQHTNRKLQYLPLNNSYSTFFQGTEVPYTSLIDRASLGLVAHMYLHIRLTVTVAPARMIPMAHWFRLIELWSSASGETLLQRWHPEALMFRHAFLSHEVMEDLCQVEGVSLGYSEDPAKTTIGVGETRDFWLPLFGSFADSSPFGVDLSNIDADLQLRIWTRPNIVGALGATITVNAMDMYVEEIDDKRGHLAMASKNLGMRFLESVDLSQTVTLTNGTKTTVTLEQLNGFTVPFILLGVRQTNTTPNLESAVTKYVDMGRGASVSLVNQAGTSIVSGNPINIDFLRHVMMAADMPGDLTTAINWFLLSFSHDPIGDLHGNVSGYHSFDSTTYRLEITPASGTGNAQVQRISMTAPGAGTVHLGYKGYWTQPIAFGADVGVIKTAFELLPSVRADRITATFGSTFAAGNTVDVTLAGPGSFPRFPLMNAYSVIAAGVTVVGAVTEQTAPVRGLPSDTAYSLLVMPFVVKEVTLHNGTWDARYLN